MKRMIYEYDLNTILKNHDWSCHQNPNRFWS